MKIDVARALVPAAPTLMSAPPYQQRLQPSGACGSNFVGNEERHRLTLTLAVAAQKAAFGLDSNRQLAP